MIAVSLALALIVGAPQAMHVSSEEVRTSIAEKGARATLRALLADEERWDQLIGEIGSGKSDWLEVAVQLRTVSDAHATETLDMALQEALPANPTGVLNLVRRGAFTAHEVCGMYGFGQIEDERPVSELVLLVDRRIAAVSVIAKPELAATRNHCLDELRLLRSRLRGEPPSN
jgi:hypothetical protein